jgi:thioredoxin reductase (NADPH)
VLTILGPVLLAVEDDGLALGDIERELRDRYASSYRVLCTGSPEEALDELTSLAESGDEVALVLAAQWLPGTTGSELLERVGQLHPHAKRALLVPWRAWGDVPTAQAIFESMALGRIDYFVLKPASAPDEVFHQSVTTFLLDWSKARRFTPYTTRIVGESWSGRAYELREVLQRCAIPHRFCLADSEEGRDLVTDADGEAGLPLVVFPNGQTLSDPSNREIAVASGASTDAEENEYDLVIVGAGPAGLSAAVYGASEGLRTLVIDEGGVGGQATSSSLIRNYLGFPRGVSGTALAEQAYEQALVMGTSFVFMQRATRLGRDGNRLHVTIADLPRVRSRAVVIATGSSYRRLGVPALEELNGAGVFYGGPVTEAPAMVGKRAFVIGGANSAGQAALHLARYARQVTMVVRAQSLEEGMSHYLVRELEAMPNVEARLGASVVDGEGDGRLEQLVLRNALTGEEETLLADGLFVLIGARPHTDWLPPELARDSRGFLLTGGDLSCHEVWPLDRAPLLLETSMAGVFAAGDVRHGSVKRVASAVGEGSIAVQLVHQYFGSEQPDPAAPTRLAEPAPRASS